MMEDAAFLPLQITRPPIQPVAPSKLEEESRIQPRRYQRARINSSWH